MMKYYDIIIVIIFLKTHFVIEVNKAKASIMAISIIGLKFLRFFLCYMKLNLVLSWDTL